MVKSVLTGIGIAEKPVQVSINKSPLASISALTTTKPIGNLGIRMSDVESLGEKVSKEIGLTTDRIIEKMSVGNFDELGIILTSVQHEADKLNPAKYKRSGVIGWIRSKFLDFKKELTLQFSTAEKVFDRLEEQISNHIAVHKEWIKDLDQLYDENYNRYLEVVKVMTTADDWQKFMENRISSWPEIDPTSHDAPMKLQELRDEKSVLQRLRVKSDYFLRLKTILENNSPKIRNQQDTSRTTISTLKDVVEQAIPAIKIEFALFIQSLDSEKSNQLIGNLRGLVNTTLQKSADTAKDASINSEINANTPTFSTDTIKHIRERMLETVTEVKRIQQESDKQRIADQKYIQESQKDYYKRCVELDAIK